MARKAVEREIFSDYYTQEAFEDARDLLFEDRRKSEWKTKKDIPDDDVLDQFFTDIDISWDNEKEQLDDFFCGKTFLAVGAVQRWNGVYDGGKLFRSVDQLLDMFSDCENIRLYDVNGHFFVHGTHHDGEIEVEVKQLTETGEKYADSHPFLDDRTLHTTLFHSSRYSHLPHYMHIVYGCPKVEYESSVKAKKKKASA